MALKDEERKPPSAKKLSDSLAYVIAHFFPLMESVSTLRVFVCLLSLGLICSFLPDF